MPMKMPLEMKWAIQPIIIGIEFSSVIIRSLKKSNIVDNSKTYYIPLKGSMITKFIVIH